MFYTPILYYPTKRRGPRHRHPDPDLRHVDAARPVDSQRVLLGDQPQPGRDLHARLVSRGPARASAASTATTSAAAPTATSRVHLARPERRRYTLDGGRAAPTGASRSYEIRGGANQAAAAQLSRARATSTTSRASVESQTFNTNIYDASRNQRTFGGNVVGAWKAVLAERHAAITASTSTRPDRLGADRQLAARQRRRATRRPLFGSPVLLLARRRIRRPRCATDHQTDGTDADHRRQRSEPLRLHAADPLSVQEVEVVHRQLDGELARHLLHPQLRRSTRDPRPTDGRRRGLNRTLLHRPVADVGPVFNRIWNTPDNGYAEKFKHSVEPFLTVQRTSPIDNFDQHHPARRHRHDRRRHDRSPTASTTGSTPSARPTARRASARRARSSTSSCRRATTPTQLAAQYDPRYQTSFSGQRSAEQFLADRAERPRDADRPASTPRCAPRFDSRYLELRTISANGTYNWTNTLQTHRRAGRKTRLHRGADRVQRSATQSRRNYPQRRRPTCTPRTTASAALYSFNYDMLHSAMLQQRIIGLLQRAVLRHRVRIPDLQLRRLSRCRRCRPTTGSSCRSRWPASAISRRSTARWAACRASTSARCRATVLVTGAAGFAGSHLIDLLAGDGARRRRLASARRLAAARRRRRRRWQAVDLLDRGAVRQAHRPRFGPAVVYHCAGAAHVGQSWDTTEPTFATNVRGTHHLLEALRDRRRRRA